MNLDELSIFQHRKCPEFEDGHGLSDREPGASRADRGVAEAKLQLCDLAPGRVRLGRLDSSIGNKIYIVTIQ